VRKKKIGDDEDGIEDGHEDGEDEEEGLKLIKKTSQGPKLIVV
jgi:hypothetical protein